MNTMYEQDLAAWADEQAALLLQGEFSLLDIEHLVEEIADVGKSEKRQLQSRLIVLMVHLLKWQFQPARRSHSWRNTICEQRAAVAEQLRDTPSLQPLLADAAWLSLTYRRASARGVAEAGLSALPSSLPWGADELLDTLFFPD